MTNLETILAVAARQAFTELFATHLERFYYCSLITSGDATRPATAAWSLEALARAIDTGEIDRPGGSRLEWGPQYSPYLDFGVEHFDEVTATFAARDQAIAGADDDAWEQEYGLRLGAMEGAMRTLDREGVFGTGASRADMVVLVEVLPPDWTNAERARRLNPRSGPQLHAWLDENAEPAPGTSM